MKIKALRPHILVVTRKEEYLADEEGWLEVPEDIGLALTEKQPELFVVASRENEGGIDDGDN